MLGGLCRVDGPEPGEQTETGERQHLQPDHDDLLNRRAQVVPELYQPQGIGMAFSEGSPLQETVSQEFLDLREDGTQETLDERYFGSG